MVSLAFISSSVRTLIYCLSSSISLLLGSSFLMGLFEIIAALAAYCKVFIFSSM